MYEVTRNGKTILEADACGIGFVATRKGQPDRKVVDVGLHLCRQFDHRGAPGHGSGVLLDIPWKIVRQRFPDHAAAIDRRDVALGMFFLPYEPKLRSECIERVEEVAALAGAEVLQWEAVPADIEALPPGSSARRTYPVFRQALFARPSGLDEDGWFACRYLLRLAVDARLSEISRDEYSLLSLSNRTVVYKGLSELSRLADLYPDLQRSDFESRFLLFHSRYCTNTTTAWSRAQPFWALAHNGEIATIDGNVAWFRAIGDSLVRHLVERYPALEPVAAEVRSIICRGGSDSQNLDDMLIALAASGMTLSQSILAVLPEASSVVTEPRLREFYESMLVYLGACDGPAAVVACDGDEAVAHLDRNGLRPLWYLGSEDVAVALSEPTGTIPVEGLTTQRVLGPGETVRVDLNSGAVEFNGDVKRRIAALPFPSAAERIRTLPHCETDIPEEALPLETLQKCFGMGKEDVDVLLEPMFKLGKPAVGSMGDDTPLSAMLDRFPRRIEDYFRLRFAQETSPPIDPIRDAWVFDASGHLGDRGGLWDEVRGSLYRVDSRVLSCSELGAIKAIEGSVEIDATSTIQDEVSPALEACLESCVQAAREATLLVISDRKVSAERAPLPMVRLISRLHRQLVQEGIRHRVALVAESGIWDIHQVALFISLGADAVCPWLGLATAGEMSQNFLRALRSGFIEAMSMMGVTPSAAYCGARLVESIGLDREFLAKEFDGVRGHLGGIGSKIVDTEWRSFHRSAFEDEGAGLRDFGEFRHSKEGRPHANNAEIVRSLHVASGYAKKIHSVEPGTYEAFRIYSDLVSNREPITILDCLEFKTRPPLPLEEVEPIENILWRFMAPGMSEGALSEPAHRSIARAFNILHRYCRLKGVVLPGVGPFANSGEGGFDKDRTGTSDANRSVQYAGGRFTITPMTAARAAEAEVKFAQGAKPGKGGQLPGKKVSPKTAQRRGCEPGYELISPPINHNLYSIEDVKLMLECWRHLNPEVNCALKYVATHGVEMVSMGGVNAGANRLHISDGCGGTGAAKRVDQKHAGIPAAIALPKVQDMLVEEGARQWVELSVDGGVQNGDQALKLMLLGADRVGFGTSLLMAIGCSMLRKCHLAGPDPADPAGKRRLGCTPGVATQDPELVARFTGKARHIVRYLVFVATEIRELMARQGLARLEDFIGRRELLQKKPGLVGKAAQLDLTSLINAPHSRVSQRDYGSQTLRNMPALSDGEAFAAHRALAGEDVIRQGCLTNAHRCIGVRAAGIIARDRGDGGLAQGGLTFLHEGSAGHYYAAYCLPGMSFHLRGTLADSAFTAAYGGKLVVTPDAGLDHPALVGSTFGYGARGGEVFIAGRAGNRFAICLRKSHEGTGAAIVVEGVGANAFQYMTGGCALVLDTIGPNLGAGMTGGVVYLLDPDLGKLNEDYVQALALDDEDVWGVTALLRRHQEETGSLRATELLARFDQDRFSKVMTKLVPEAVFDLPVAAEQALSR